MAWQTLPPPMDLLAGGKWQFGWWNKTGHPEFYLEDVKTSGLCPTQGPSEKASALLEGRVGTGYARTPLRPFERSGVGQGAGVGMTPTVDREQLAALGMLRRRFGKIPGPRRHLGGAGQRTWP
jgi:hypothetical protein